MDTILSFKKDLETYSDTALSSIQRYLGFPVVDRNDLVWLIAVHQATSVKATMPNMNADGNVKDGGEYENAEEEYENAEGEYENAEGEYEDAEGEYEDAEGEYEDAEGEYEDAEGEYDEDEDTYFPKEYIYERGIEDVLSILGKYDKSRYLNIMIRFSKKFDINRVEQLARAIKKEYPDPYDISAEEVAFLYSNDLRLLEKLLEDGDCINCRWRDDCSCRDDGYWRAPLSNAIESGHWEKVKFLLSNGANVDQCVDTKCTFKIRDIDNIEWQNILRQYEGGIKSANKGVALL